MLNNLFSAEVLQETLSIVQGQFLLAFWETLYVTIAAMFFAVVIGLPLGVLLVVLVAVIVFPETSLLLTRSM